ncbi:unnamed protein product [Vicia faba]|uniref:Uncharacterized protein n=1 Tax=Vicia faba TaxID=3906 RepID=A0AAV0ZMK7_VICFA|nr:unnamed protein product [Vicia faba]
MALSLGKITILLGAGLVGSAIAKKGRSDHTPTVKNPQNDALCAQVDSLWQEIEFLIREKSIIFVNPSGSGRNHYKGTESEMTFSGRNPELPGCTSSLQLSENHLWQVPASMERHLVAGDELKNPNQQILYKL